MIGQMIHRGRFFDGDRAGPMQVTEQDPDHTDRQIQMGGEFGDRCRAPRACEDRALFGR